MKPDLFSTPEPEPAEPRVFSVSELTRSVRKVIESQVGTVWVEGEISNLRKQASGHQYFVLKDATSQLSCVLFARGGAWRKEVALSDGMQVQVRGTMTVYEARGQYQLNVQLVQAGGAGLLQARFEALKRKLEAEGLFDADRKRPLPAFPKAVGIVTSPTGAALRDMLNILGRRAPWLRVVVSPVRVQGEGAAGEIAAAIAELNRFAEFGLEPVDVIVIGRGGGSVEDLWAFNEEEVARAVAASAIPVVSAVGHEIDFTIADFAADLRAPTPSAAAELIAPDSAGLLARLAQVREQMTRRLQGEVGQSRTRLAVLTGGALFREPRNRLNAAMQRLDLAAENLRRRIQERVAQIRQEVAGQLARVRQHRPDQALALQRQRLEVFAGRLGLRLPQEIALKRQRLEGAAARLRLLAPDAVLARGYSLTTLADGTLVASTAVVPSGAKLLTRVSDGIIASTAD